MAHRKAKLDLEVRDLEDRVRVDAGAQNLAAKELSAVEAEIAAKRNQLLQAKAALQSARERENSLAVDLASNTAALQALYAKQGGDERYKTVAQRDTALKKEISGLEAAIRSKRDNVQVATAHAEEAELAVHRAEEAVAESRAAWESCYKELESIQAEVMTVRSQRDELQNRQKSLWRREDDAKKEHERLREELRARDKIMEAAAPRDITRGLNSVKRAVAQHGIQGVHGTLMELFQCPPALNTAVETVAGSSLFHIVVDSDDVATQLTEILIREKSGRATFMPLNRLAPGNATIPTTWGSDVMSLLKMLKFDSKFAPAMQQIFGKVVVCRTLALATQVAEETDGALHCVTLDGDEVERRGALRGGYVDVRKSRIEAMREYKKFTLKLAEAEGETKGIETELAEVSQAITEATARLTGLHARQQHLQEKTGPARVEMRTAQAKRDELQRTAEGKTKLVRDLEMGIVALEAELEQRKRLMGTPLRRELTAEERDTLARLQPAVDGGEQGLAEAKRARM